MSQKQIVIVGAGIIGLSTAYALLKNGMKRVMVVEQAEVDHARSTSRGVSRLLRFEYGADIFYSELVRLSLERWRKLERIAGQTLYTRTGLLVLGREDDGMTLPGYHALCGIGVPTTHLSKQTCMTRFPAFHTQNYDTFTYTREAGILHASRCLHALKALVLELGGQVHETCQVTRWTSNARGPVRVHLSSGDTIDADRLVLATGPWVHHLLGNLQLPIRLTRQYLLYFSPTVPSQFRLQAFPAFMADDLYGFPIHPADPGHGVGWVKVASHAFGEEVNPDALPIIKKSVIEMIAEHVYTLLPALRQAELSHVDACMYDVSRDEDFILDYHPDDTRVIFATGLTGHGFKFSPLLGELLASMVDASAPAITLQRFRLARFEPLQHRRPQALTV